ncbi:MAG: peptidoglycan DD-metalloendopeptidase family protein [Bacteroidia bacterium]
MEKHEQIADVLKKNRDAISPVVRLGVKPEDIIAMDFSESNEEIKKIDIDDVEGFTEYIESLLDKFEKVGVGGYGEDRSIYRRSSLFDGEGEPRSIHLGLDIWIPAGTKVYAPLDATVHSYAYNDTYGDYGGTIILEHNLEDTTFYTLYGHLSKDSLENMDKDKHIEKGEHFAYIGRVEENGQWPPHLHFQLITDMLDKEGDFYGVAPPSEKEEYMKLCPNPYRILKIQ